MFRHLFIRFGIFAVLTCTAPSASARPEPPNPGQRPKQVIAMLHTSWTAREGAPAGSRGIAQTPDGWIWMGGKSGLYKFDGVRFMRAVGREAPLGANISALGVLRNGMLWVGYYHGGVSLMEAGGLHHFPPALNSLSATMVTAAEQDAAGRLWLGTAGGLYYFDAGWHRADAALESACERVHGIQLDWKGVLWVRSEAGLFSLAAGASRFDRKLAAIGYGTLATHPDGSLWTTLRGSPKPVLVTEPKLGPPLKWDVTESGSMIFDREGYMWAVTGFGVARFSHLGTGVPAQETGLDHGLSGNIVSAMFEDREQNFWIATENGLDRFRKPRLRSLPLSKYTLYAGRPIAGGPGASAWVDRFNIARPDAAPVPFAPDRDKVISALYRSPDGKVWVGGDDQLWAIGKAGEVAIPRPPGVPANALVLNMAKDGDGALWVNFGSKGLYSWRDGRWSTRGDMLHNDGSPVVAMAADRDRRMWLGFVNGNIALVANGQARYFGHADGLAVGAVAQILPMKEGAWVGGENGLAYFDGTRFRAIVGRGGEPFTGITGLVFGRDGTLWINGSSGISSIQGSELLRTVQDPGHEARFGRLDYRDGLRGVPISIYPLPSATASDDGTLWFSTLGGVYALDPETFPRNLSVAPVRIISLRSGTTEFPLLDGARLPARTEMLRIDFTALSFQSPERMEFRYRLEGGDAGWRESTGDRSAHYTNLGPGHYRFRVMASNNDGVWNKEEASLAFEIAPSLTQTTWFRALCLAALINLLIALYFLRTNQLARRYGDKLQERLAERERIARALHDTLLQGMQGLILKFQSIAKRLPADDQNRWGLETILDQADLLMAEGRAEVLGLRSHVKTSDDLLDAISQYGSSLQELFGPAFALLVSGTQREINHNARQEIYAIAREAIFNAYRHARAANIAVEFAYHGSGFHLFVRDDGIGIPQEFVFERGKQAHWGLLGMKERATVLGASIELCNLKGKGTEVALRVPAACAYV